MNEEAKYGTVLRSRWSALALLAAGLVVSGVAALQIKSGVDAAAQREFEYSCNEIRVDIEARLEAGAQILRSGAALFDASETVSREQWRTFTQRLQVERHLPGIQGIGFSLWVPRAQLAKHEQAIRSEGYPDYAVRPAGDREIYSAIIYLEPFENRNQRAFGYDMFSEPVRRAAMERARDEGAAALSGQVTLVQEVDQDVQAGTLMYVPVYRHGLPTETVEQRRVALTGWVYSPYRMTDLMRGILRGRDVSRDGHALSFQVYDGDGISANALLYDSHSRGEVWSASRARDTRLIPVEFAGHGWTLRFSSLGGLAAAADYDKVWLTLAGGLVISLLLFGLMHSLIHMGVGARQLREEIDERKRADEEARMAVVYLDTMPDVLIVTTPDTKIITVNKAFSDLWGYTSEEVVGKPVFNFFPEDEWSRHRKEMEAAITQGMMRQFESRIRTKNGDIVPVELSGNIIMDEGGRVLSLVAVIRDITESNQAKDNVNRLLEQSDKSRAALLGILEDQKRVESEHEQLQAQYAQAQKMESVGRLAGGVAHDINNLIMIIMGNADLCRDQIEPGHPIRALLDEITAATERSAETTGQLLAFARKQAIEPKILDLNDVVAGMLNLLRRLIGEDIKLVWRPGPALPLVKLDPSQGNQILANLCVNSRDAIAGVGEMILETGSLIVDEEYAVRSPDALPGAYVFLAVSDNGSGMDQGTLAQVFEPFFTTKGLGKGTGLGLATVYGIVRQNNGFIEAVSEPGRGTTFKICLPQVAAEVKAPVACKAEVPAGQGETILLVEDEKSLGAICRRSMEALGYHVLMAETPGEALQMTDRHPGAIHLLLTDVVMPGMDGRQLAQRICEAKPGIKILFMSGYTADVIAQRGVLDKGVQFLAKPFTRDDLAHKLRAVLDTKGVSPVLS